MILKQKATKSRKAINLHFCDFCHTTYPESILTTTEHLRYDLDSEEFGREAVCKKCLDLMLGTPHNPLKKRK